MSIADDIVDGELCPLCACPEDICSCSSADIASSGGDIFLANRKNHRVQDQSAQYEALLAEGAKVSIKNQGLHWIICKGNRRYDYWPTKDKYQVFPTRGIQFGFDGLLKSVREL
jgi:hypothetical protein